MHACLSVYSILTFDISYRFVRAAGEECINPMERYEGPTFGTEQSHMVLDSEGNVHESDQKVLSHSSLHSLNVQTCLAVSENVRRSCSGIL